jgi:hypothetical protein
MSVLITSPPFDNLYCMIRNQKPIM